MQLCDMKIGQKGRITKVGSTDKIYRNRLIAMGLLPGTVIEVLRIAPFGDPVEIGVRGYSLSLRKGEAGVLEMSEVLL